MLRKGDAAMKPVVDYRKLRFKNITQPQYRHLLLLLGWVFYFTMYVLTELQIPTERCTAMHCFLDDLIPFCEVFIVPYVFWYFLVAGSLLYFLLFDVDSFKKLSVYILITQIIAMAIYILLPNRQDLRPTEFPRDNIFTHMVQLIYTIDTNTNVCPSLHVGYSLGIASVWLKKKDAPHWVKAFVVVTVILVCMSVAFVKQHSVLDFFAAIPMCILAEFLTFYCIFK